MNSMKHTKTSYKILSLLLCASMLLPLCACGEKSAEKTVTAMNSAVTVTAYGSSRTKAAEDACAVFTAFDGVLDPEKDSSTVYALNHAAGQSVVVPSQIVDMYNAAKTIYDQSNGALDLTVYPLLQLWGFTSGNYTKPSDDDIGAAKKLLGFDEVSIQSFPDSGTYTMTLPAGRGITFNAAARGCAADGAIDAMASDGVTSGIVSMPGCVETIGSKPDGSQWNVAVQDPDAPEKNLGYVAIGEAALSTSGAYTQSFTYADGTVYGHIIDPTTGAPAETDLKSVTVVCSSGITADLLSTALYVMGKKDALKYWREYGDFQMILVTDSNQVLCTSGLTESFTLESQTYTLSYTE